MGTYILGMAKSQLRVSKGQFGEEANVFVKPLSSGSAKSLELDYLRLVFAYKELSAKGDIVHAYLMVTTDEIVKLVKQWKTKYEINDDVVHVVAAFSESDKCVVLELAKEKTNNRLGNVTGGTKNSKDASAKFGQETLEDRLKTYIISQHEDVENIGEACKMPFGIRWDYCAILG